MYIIVSWKTAVYGVEKLLIIFYTHTKQLQKERKKNLGNTQYPERTRNPSWDELYE